MKQFIFPFKRLGWLKKLISILVPVVIVSCFTGIVHAQVTIGSGIAPNHGSLLDLKEKEPVDMNKDNSNADKGFNLPRVRLSKINALYPMFLKNPEDSTTAINDYKNNKIKIDKSHTGLLVYNVGPSLDEGVYYWDGVRWNMMGNDSTKISVPTESPAITALLCGSAIVEKQQFTNGDTSFETYARIPYTGGNGSQYAEGPEIDCLTGNGLVSGLKVQLQSGKLEENGGDLVYKIWAAPAVIGNSPNVAKFPVSFPNNKGGNESCVLTIGNAVTYADTKSYATIGPLIRTIDSEHQKEIVKSAYVPGYERVATTPDGRWSIRAFVPRTLDDPNDTYTKYNGTTERPYACTLQEVDISIRANNMDQDRDIMWSANVVYTDGDYSATNILHIPKEASDRWGGSTGGAGNISKKGDTSFWVLYPGSVRVLSPFQGAAWQVALANSNVFEGSTPENRIYTFTEIGDDTNPPYLPRTVYTVTFMMGAAGDLTKTITDESAALTTVYFKIEQSTSME